MLSPDLRNAAFAEPAKRLALGTVQFGLPYGSRRPANPVSAGEAGKLLAAAWQAGIDMLDTAPIYGAAEETIGASIGADARFQVVSKTIGLPREQDPDAAVDVVCRRVRASAQKISPGRFYAVLVHDEKELLGACGERLFAALSRLKAEGLFSKLGVSVYTPQTLLELLDRYPIDIAQVPFNVLDRRFVSPAICARLARANVELHARSIYLQGYLLRDPAAYPPHLAALRGNAERFNAAATRAGVSPMVACLGAAFAQPQIERLVVGCDSVADFAETLAAAKIAAATEAWPDWTDYADDSAALDPRTWPR